MQPEYLDRQPIKAVGGCQKQTKKNTTLHTGGYNLPAGQNHIYVAQCSDYNHLPARLAEGAIWWNLHFSLYK